MFADLSGTLTTMIALCPILFVGGYPQTIFRPLAATLLLALSASYIISITAVPLLSRKILAMNHPFILGAESFFWRITDRMNESIQIFFSNAVLVALRSKFVTALYFILLAGLFVLSLRVVLPLVGQELLPPMDTGGMKVNLVVDPNLPMQKSRKIVAAADDMLAETGRLLRLSSAIGSEPGVFSIGSGGGMDRISMTATYVDRHHRKESLWDMERQLRPLLGSLENVKRCDVMDYGATALSSIRANIDVMLSGPDLKDLETAGDRVEKALYETSGLVSVSRTWSSDKTVYILDVAQERLAFYNLSRADISRQLQTVLRGARVALFPLQNSVDFGVRVWFRASDRNSWTLLLSRLIDSPKGRIPLEAVASITTLKEPDMITREGLNYTLNVYGFREKAAISHIMERFEKAFENTPLPPSVTMAHTGDMKQFTSFPASSSTTPFC